MSKYSVRIERETRFPDHATVIYGIHEAGEGHVNRTTCADPNCAADGFDSGTCARWYIDTGKKFDARGQNMVTKMEELQDAGQDRQGRRAQASRIAETANVALD